MLPLLVDIISTSGPMPFDEFMERCLYDADDGFFSAGAVRPGEQADFVTSPEISPLFGALIGSWVSEQGVGENWALVEIGAGSGAMLGPMRDAIPDGHDVWVTERSAAAREGIASLWPDVGVVESITDVPAANAVVVMNEVLDNVPAALVRRVGSRWVEIAVDQANGELVLVETDPRDEVAAWANVHLRSQAPGSLGSVQLGAAKLIQSVLSSFDGVAMCIIDYGGPTAELADRTDQSIVRTYRHQRTGFDYLRHPGETDITVDVNTDALAATARSLDASVAAMTQREFLDSLGARALINDLRSLEYERAQSGDVVGQLRARSDAISISTLIDPRGFGNFRVVTLTREPRGKPPSL